MCYRSDLNHSMTVSAVPHSMASVALCFLRTLSPWSFQPCGDLSLFPPSPIMVLSVALSRGPRPGNVHTARALKTFRSLPCYVLDLHSVCLLSISRRSSRFAPAFTGGEIFLFQFGLYPIMRERGRAGDNIGSSKIAIFDAAVLARSCCRGRM